MTPQHQPSTVLQFKKAQYVTKKARIGLCGVSGSGKTLTALKIAQGICSENPKIALVDTENNSSVLYADRIDFVVLNIEPPFEIEKYISAIRQAEQAGFGVLILDSISHAWAGEGGLLDVQGKLADGGMNSFAAWRKLTPQHNAFVEAMIRSKLHVIATMRSKMDYIIEQTDKGKAVPKKVGLAPIQRDGLDYEFDIVFDLDLNHNAVSSKDRSSMFDGKVITKPNEEIGQKIIAWLNRTPHKVEQASPTQPPLFNDNGHQLGEKETEAMLDAIRKATTVERLFSIEQSMSKGLSANKITAQQAEQVKQAIQARSSELDQTQAA